MAISRRFSTRLGTDRARKARHGRPTWLESETHLMIVYTLSIILLGAVIVYVFLTPGGRVIQPIPRWQYVSGDTFVHGNDL
jgi:hypothetical protein